jgi:hypothetical protein
VISKFLSIISDKPDFIQNRRGKMAACRETGRQPGGVRGFKFDFKTVQYQFLT